MAIPSFFKQNKPRGFNYVPRYYDPAKEELEQRRRAWGAKKEAQDEGPGAQRSDHEAQGTASQPYRSTIMRGDMRNHFQRRKERVERHTTIRLLVIIIIIVLVVYLYLRF